MAMFDRFREMMRQRSFGPDGTLFRELGESFAAHNPDVDDRFPQLLTWLQCTLLLHDERDTDNHVFVFDINNIADMYIDNNGKVDNDIFGSVRLPGAYFWAECDQHKIFETTNRGKAAVFMWENPTAQTLHSVYLREVPGSVRILPVELLYEASEQWEIDQFHYRYGDFTHLGEERAQAEIETYAALQMMAFKCLMFLHTKNVQILRQVQPTKIQQKREKKAKLPLVDTRIVTVRGIHEKVERERIISSTDTSVPFHIVRGHFADYREKGLFGKYPGIYWIPQHSRGSLEHGTIKKRYTTPQHVTV